METDKILELTTAVVAAYVSRNALPADQLPALVAETHAALTRVARGETAPGGEPKASEAERVPAVPVKKSVTHDHIVCLEDGKRFKSLKRHLAAAYGLTPDQYRQRWGLPVDYPMVAPAYAAVRSGLAKKHGLGRSNGAARA